MKLVVKDVSGLFGCWFWFVGFFFFVCVGFFSWFCFVVGFLTHAEANRKLAGFILKSIIHL